MPASGGAGAVASALAPHDDAEAIVHARIMPAIRPRHRISAMDVSRYGSTVGRARAVNNEPTSNARLLNTTCIGPA
eukprot:5796234-Pyramimonas_sp.AAC.1